MEPSQPGKLISTSTSERRSERSARRKKDRLLSLALLGGGLLLLGAMVFILVRSQAGEAGEKSGVHPPRVGQPLSNLELTDLSGNTVHLADFAGHPILINAWATWCPPCKAEMPVLEAFYQAHRSEGFVLLGIDDGEAKQTVQDFVKDNGYTIPIYLDENSNLVSRMGITGLPTSILIGRDGIVKVIHEGMYTEADLQVDFGPLLQAR